MKKLLLLGFALITLILLSCNSKNKKEDENIKKCWKITSTFQLGLHVDSFTVNVKNLTTKEIKDSVASFEKNIKEKTIKNGITNAAFNFLYTEINCDSLIKKEKEDSIAFIKKEKEDSILAIKSISIIKCYSTSPNSAGGVDLNIVWKNISDKIVKYAYFEAVPLNAVGDIVSSDIGGVTTFRGKLTGPIKPGQVYGYGSSWSCAWYNWSIKTVKLTKVEIQYMDDSTISLEGKCLDYIAAKK